MYVNNIAIENMGPIDHLYLGPDLLLKPDSAPKPIVIIGKNGSGKTTLISHIADAMLELANNAYRDILPVSGISHKYFRPLSTSNIKVHKEFGFAFLNFQEKEVKYQYVEKIGELKFEEFEKRVGAKYELPGTDWDEEKNYKKISTTSSDELFKEDLKNNSYCYFPSDRFEYPYWLNREAYKSSDHFIDYSRFSGNLHKDIVVNKTLDEIKSWILDVFLDSRADIVISENGEPGVKNLNDILQLQGSIKNIEIILSLVLQEEISLKVGYRGWGRTRIKIIDKKTNQDLIPSLNHLSAGQSTLLAIFASIIRHSEFANLIKSISLEKIEGIVLIDEADLHLHINLQHEVFPKLVSLFPKVQFIITTQSPFLVSGMRNEFVGDDLLLVNMPSGQVVESTESFEEFNSAYCIFNNLTNSYQQELFKLKGEIEKSTIPLIVTEGKTDWKHLKAAFKSLKSFYNSMEIEFLEYGDEKEDEVKMGDTALKSMVNGLKILPNNRKVIFIFDRDNKEIVKAFGRKEFNKHDNNVFSFCIPPISNELNKICIEYYYDKSVWDTFDLQGRRLFDGREFYPESMNSKDGKFQTKKLNLTGKLCPIDSAVYDRNADLELQNSIALSKNDFAEHILNQKEGFGSVEFGNFKKIFNIIKEITDL